MKKHSIVRELLLYAVLVVGFILVLSLLFTNNGTKEVLTYDDVIRYVENGQVRTVHISNKNIVTLQIDPGDGKLQKVTYKTVDIGLFHADLGEKINQQVAAGIITEYGIALVLSFLVIPIVELVKLIQRARKK